MKRSATQRQSTPAGRKGRVAAIVANAKTRGEKVPRGINLIGFDPLSERAQAHAQTLVPAARRAVSRKRAVAA